MYIYNQTRTAKRGWLTNTSLIQFGFDLLLLNKNYKTADIHVLLESYKNILIYRNLGFRT